MRIPGEAQRTPASQGQRTGTRAQGTWKSIALLYLGFVGCPREQKRQAPVQVDSAHIEKPAQTSAPTATELGPANDQGSRSVRELVLTGDLQTALTQLDKKSPPNSADSKDRMLRAVLLHKLGRDAESVIAWNDLERELPLLADYIQEQRAIAQLGAGLSAQGARVFAAKAKPEHWVTAMLAYEKANLDSDALAMAGKILGDPARKATHELEARGLRSRVLHDGIDNDRVWLLTHFPAHAYARKVEAYLPKLSSNELEKRALALASAGQVDEALQTAGRVHGSKEEACHLRAKILYSVKQRYGEASAAYRECEQLGRDHRPEDAFLSARALSRANRDQEAIAQFRRVVSTYKKSSQAEQAGFLAARLELLLGEASHARASFEKHMRNYPSAARDEDTRRLYALSLFLSDNPKRAHELFEEFAAHPDPGLAARGANLAALGLYQSGERRLAVARWTELVRSKPWSFGALCARGHLEALHEPLPSFADRAVANSIPLTVKVPEPVPMLIDLGLDERAEKELTLRERAVLSPFETRSTEALCLAYEPITYARRRRTFSELVTPALLASMPDASSKWAWGCVYPEAHKPVVERAAARFGVPKSLVYAVMRAESAFDPQAVSPVGAVGLMQLMTETAKVVRDKHHLADGPLIDPLHNIEVGTALLADLLKEFPAPLAVAGYNAGAEAVTRWRSHWSKVPVEVFAELIPYNETRHYVFVVMEAFARYEQWRENRTTSFLPQAQ